jgi:hypothetical protein
MLSANVVHAAVTGMTGAGKSTLMNAMILSSEMSGQAVALFDPSGGFYQLSGHSMVWRGGLFRKVDDCAAGLAYLAAAITDEASTVPRPLLIFVDEVPELIRQAPEIQSYIAALAGVGRQADMHLVIGAQHPLAEELGPTTMRNIPTRITGRVTDKMAAKTVTGHSDSGAENLRGGGDMIIYVGGVKTHFQAAMPSGEQLNEWAHRYPPCAVNVPRDMARGVPTMPQDVASQANITDSKIMSSGAPFTLGPRKPHGGSEVDPIPEIVLTKIRRYYRENHSKPPSGQWVRRLTKGMKVTDYREFNALKAARAIYEALLAAGIEYEGYDPASQETAGTVIAGTVERGKI